MHPRPKILAQQSDRRIDAHHRMQSVRDTDGAMQQLPELGKCEGIISGRAGSPSMMLRRFLLLMVVFAAGAATATYFGAGHVGPANAPTAVKPAATIPPQQPAPAPQLVPHESEPAPQRAVRVIPIVRPESETTGGPAAEQETHSAQPPEAAPEQPRCDRRACSRAYRSFDAATCSYRPARGGPRRLCEK